MVQSLRLRVEPTSVVAFADELKIAEAAGLAEADPTFWEALARTSGETDAWEVTLSPPDTYPVRFLKPPRSLFNALREHAPLLPEHLVWSSLHDDSDPVVTIAKRERLAEITSILETHGLRIASFTDPDGHVFGAGRASRPVAQATLIIAALALATIPFSIAAGIFVMRSTALAPASPARVEKAAELAPHPTLARTIATIGEALPRDLRIASVERRADGKTSVTIDTSNPGDLQAALRRSATMTSWRVVSQEALEDGEARLVVRGQLP